MRKPRTLTEVRPDMTPMIDVTFQLLIFFLVATKFKALEQRLDSFLPDGGDAGRGVPLETLRLTVSGFGEPGAFTPRVELLGRSLGAYTPAGAEGYWARLADLIAARKNDFDKVEIDAAPFVPWEFVIAVQNACQAAECRAIVYRAPPLGGDR